jgi:hypothetical protein
MLMLALAFAQGGYFVVSGAWALVDIDSFQRVTGPKTELWLVKTIGLLLVGIGAALILAATRRQVESPVILIAMASAAALVAVEIVYVSKRVIARIYLADAAIEAVFLSGWAIALLWRDQ